MRSVNIEIRATLRLLLDEAVKRNLSEGLLLSGGLDTSILAFMASKLSSLKAFTVAFKGTAAPDVKYAILMAHKLRLKHYICYFDKIELFDAIKEVIKVVRSFDPMEIRNSVTIYVGLKVAKEKRLNSVMTGDGCDELFAGYSFLFNLEKEQLEIELKMLWNVMSFSSIPLGKALGIEVRLPYLDPNLKSYATTLDSQHKIHSERGLIWVNGSFAKLSKTSCPRKLFGGLRHLLNKVQEQPFFQACLAERSLIWSLRRKKSSILKKDRVTIRDKEQLFYYEVYRAALGVPHPIDPEGKLCPQCNSNVAEKATYCRTCGACPIIPLRHNNNQDREDTYQL